MIHEASSIDPHFGHSVNCKVRGGCGLCSCDCNTTKAPPVIGERQSNAANLREQIERWESLESELATANERIALLERLNANRQQRIVEDTDRIRVMRGKISELEERILQADEEWYCDNCKTVIPGPPAPLASCVVCQVCTCPTMPKATFYRMKYESSIKRIAELEAALKPFAELWKCMTAELGTTHFTAIIQELDSCEAQSLTHLRNAARALGGE